MFMSNGFNSSDPRVLPHMKNPHVVAFFGPDGAGKSTQAELLIEYLQQNGLRVKKAWIRSVHTFAFLLWNIFRKLNLLSGQSDIARGMQMRPAVSYVNETSYGAVSAITTSPPILVGSVSRLIWSSIEVISVIPVILLQVYLPLSRGYVVVAERYVLDSVASIAYFLADANFIDSWNARLLMKLVPRNTVFIFVDADYQTILHRRGETAGPIDYTEFHRQVFNRLANRMGAYRIDTTKLSIEAAHEKIVSIVMSN
jgi:thymidylate kinase